MHYRNYDNSNIFEHPAEQWDEERCRKAADYSPADTYGGRPPKGIIASYGSPHPQPGLGVVWYNGGKIIGGVLYSGERIPLPEIPEGYRFDKVESWGIVIQEK